MEDKEHRILPSEPSRSSRLKAFHAELRLESASAPIFRSAQAQGPEAESETFSVASPMPFRRESKHKALNVAVDWSRAKKTSLGLSSKVDELDLSVIITTVELTTVIRNHPGFMRFSYCKRRQ